MTSAGKNGRRPPGRSGETPNEARNGETSREASGETNGGTTAGPRPNRVHYNDWREVEVEPLRSFVPTLPVSIVVPCREPAPGILERTLAALEGQTYPRDRFEVVLVDDGSDPPLRPPGGTPFPLRLVRRERRGGFGLARARNAGAEAARHDLLLFLDCDLLVEAWWIAAHARWHHRVSDVVTVGRYADVSPEGLDPDRIRNRPGPVADLFAGQRPRPRPGAEHLLRTNDLTSRADDPFRALLGGNFGVGRKFYRSVGGHDESFRRWGMEEIEFGYRAHTRGALFAPVPEAFAFHQGTADRRREQENERSLRLQRTKCAHLIAHREFRGRPSGRLFSVPRLVVNLPCGEDDDPADDGDSLAGAVTAILSDRMRDLVVRVEGAGEHAGADAGADRGDRAALLREMFDPDPRVRFAAGASALDDFPASPFHLEIPPAVRRRGFRKDLAHRLFRRLGDAVTVTAEAGGPGGGAAVSLTRAWALHRARRAGGTAADYGETRRLPASVLGLGRPRGAARGPAAAPGLPGARERLLSRAASVRGPAELGSFLRWLAAVVGRRASERFGFPRGARLRPRPAARGGAPPGPGDAA